MLHPNYKDLRTHKHYGLRPDSFATLLTLIKFEVSAAHERPITPRNPLHTSVAFPHGWNLMPALRTDSLTQHDTINLPTRQRPNIQSPKYSIRAAIVASNLHSMARSRAGTAAKVDQTSLRGVSPVDTRSAGSCLRTNGHLDRTLLSFFMTRY